MDPAAGARGRMLTLAGPTPGVGSGFPRGLPSGAREAGSVPGNRGKDRRAALPSRLSKAKPGTEPNAAALCHAALPGPALPDHRPGGCEAHGPSRPISLRP